MNSAKLRLSAEEEAMINNSQLILTKNRLLEQLTCFLSTLQQAQESFLQQQEFHLPEEILIAGPKITKGEQYLGLPYRVLDYPRLYGQTDILAIRTLFLWGNYFSVSLLLAGSWKERAIPALTTAWPRLASRQFYYCTGSDPWQQHFSDDYYSPVTISAEIIQEQASRPFIKLASRYPLSDWENLEEKLLDDFRLLVTAAGLKH